ncbi:HEAT repeat domain-containing protein [Lentzea sp. BCCO 10_0061]|uniref:HEAT repeat domain-containing protein n=1 Tax=Lentzea sokolovensis TaxID=3095429 RepID=A0ABU4UR84_9PSEU|nr:HEAT repeat domain-containing protein [Lentzea sp. BCCO 10_0061]MDX8141936.1 HEAT repeat domain-containing protein [Lentzea sp. BCCO 10_0061]
MSQDLSPMVDNVPWVSLQHHYGSAEDIPALLLASATDPDAFGELHNKVYHQGGGILSAAPPVLPVLVLWAHDPGFALRDAAIRFIGDLAQTARKADPEYVNAAWPTAWQEALPRLLDLLSDPDPVVRRAAASPLGQAADQVAHVLPALLARWHEELDEAARLKYVLAAAQLLRDTSGEWPVEVIDWLSSLRENENPALRFAGAMAARHCGLGGRDPRHVDEAASYLSTADLAVWHDVWSVGRRVVGRLLWWTNDFLDDDRDGRTRLAATLLGSADADRRTNALTTAAAVMERWRSPVTTLLPLVANRLSDPDSRQRRSAASILASAGRAAAPWTAQLLDACEDEPAVALPALQALVKIGAPEAVGLVADLLDAPGHTLSRSAGCNGPSLSNLLKLLRPAAAQLLPGVRRRLTSSSMLVEQRDLLLVLANWGPDARDAFAEITSFIGTEAEDWALDALIALDSEEAREAALPAVVAAKDVPVSTRAAVRRWKVTGEPGELLVHLQADDPNLRQHAEVLAQLGPAAARLADRVRDRTALHRGWALVELQYALWRMTGDPEDGLSFATATRLAISSDGVFGRYCIRAVGNLVSLGTLAAPAVSVLRPLLTTDVRPTRGIPDDDLLCETVREVLAAAGSVSPCHRSPSSTPPN